MDNRPCKRARLESSSNVDLPLQAHGHDFGNVAASGSAPVHLGDNWGIQNHYYSQQPPHSNRSDDSDQRFEALIKSLQFPRMDARVNNVSKALNNTCTWLFRHKHFAEWHSGRTLRQHNGFLWIKGKPGCGKSTIMKTTLEWAQRQSRQKKTERKVIHYFFDARAPNSLEKSTLGLYRFLVFQILDLYPSLQSHFVAKFTNKCPEQPDDQWTKNELQDFLFDIVHLGSSCSLYIFIDALDEGEEQQDVRNMINFLVDLSESAFHPDSSLNLRICLSSRHYPHISVKKGLSLTVEDQAAHDHDIEIYVRKKLSGEDGMTNFGASPIEELAAEVCRRSAGIFLWVVLVIRLLHEVEDRGGTPPEMRQLLDTIPSDLNELFKNILTRSDHGVERCITLLQWVLFATRSLRPDELYLAIEYSLSPADSTWAPPSEILVPSEDHLSLYILEFSRGLVELTSTGEPVVQFIHETVHDYLLHSNGLAPLLPASTNDFIGESHEVLKISCARYLSRTELPIDLQDHVVIGYTNKNHLEEVKNRLRMELRFIEYSMSHLFDHAEQAQTYGISQTLFLQDRVLSYGIWKGKERSWINVFERFAVRKYASNITLVYFLADRGLTHLLQSLVSISTTDIVNRQCGRYGTALSAACVNGKEDNVRILMAAGADLYETSGEYKHPILAALYSKNYSLIDILQGEQVSLTRPLLHKAFFEMIARGSVQGVTRLLRLGADAGWTNSRQQAALQVAWIKTQPQIFDLLLRSLCLVAPRLATEMRSDTRLLVRASSMGYARVVEYLIRSGAPLEEREDSSRTALQQACLDGQTEIVRLLIRGGADINALMREYGNTLQAVCVSSCSFDLVKLLIDNGANVNGKTGSDGTALQWACIQGKDDVVQLLLENGATIGTQGGKFGCALHAACYCGTVQAVQLLIDKGADINARSSRFGSALQAACHRKRDYIDIVWLLIANRANVNARDDDHGTALQVACSLGHLDLVRLLIKYGADVNARGGQHRSALHAAVLRGNSTIVQILIDEGADVNLPAPETHLTALSILEHELTIHPFRKDDFQSVLQILGNAGAVHVVLE